MTTAEIVSFIQSGLIRLMEVMLLVATFVAMTVTAPCDSPNSLPGDFEIGEEAVVP